MLNQEIKFEKMINNIVLPGPTHRTPVTGASMPAPIHLTATVTNARLRRPHRPRLGWIAVPGPSLHWTTAKKAILTITMVRNHHQAGTAPGGEEKAPAEEREAQRRVPCMPSTLSEIAALIWSNNATCSGKGSTRSGVRNISTAM